MIEDRPTIWIAWNDKMADGYYDIVGPFLDGDACQDFVDLRLLDRPDESWTSGIMTYPEDWKRLYYPWEHPDGAKRA